MKLSTDYTRYAGRNSSAYAPSVPGGDTPCVTAGEDAAQSIEDKWKKADFLRAHPLSPAGTHHA